MAEIRVTFEDGAVERLPAGIAAGEAIRRHAERDGAGRARLERAVAARVEADGSTVVDLTRPLVEDCRLAPVAPESAEGLDVIRHSAAHLMAQAVKRLFPETEITIGPVIENGFYYDFKRPQGFTPEDLARIEQTMRQIVAENLPVTRQELPRPEAVRLFRDMGEHYKVEIIEGIPDEVVSLYRQGEFVDLCRGPHVPSTGRIPAFRLTKVAGAYWRGDSRNEMLQRIYGTAWAKKEDQDAYLHRLEEAEKRDHRKLGRQLDLFHLQDEAPGMVFWHPKGWTIWQQVEQYMRRIYRDNGYEEVRGPMILDRSLWERSGHWENYKEHMFTTESEKRDFAIKPMNCPGHVQIFNSDLRSYRDLPLRYGEFGFCHRNEASGALHGLMRVRAFVQDDGHIFCTPEQIEAEVTAFNRLALSVYKDFGFEDISIRLALRPEKRIGSDETWDRAEG